MTPPALSLAALTVLELSPPDMVEVAAQAGYSHIGLRLIPATPEEHHFPLLADLDLRRQTLARLRDTGVRVLDIEILRLKPETQIDTLDNLLEAGAELGASELLVAGNDADFSRLTDNFAALCERARPYGLYPNLEFMPWTNVPDLKTALRVIEQAGQANGRVLVDAFHFNRSKSQLEDLKSVPADFWRYAQLCDVAGPCPDDMDEILRQARNERRFPGDGDCDLMALLSALPKSLPLSLEVPTRQLLEQGVSALERARLARDKALDVLSKTER